MAVILEARSVLSVIKPLGNVLVIPELLDALVKNLLKPIIFLRYTSFNMKQRMAELPQEPLFDLLTMKIFLKVTLGEVMPSFHYYK